MARDLMAQWLPDGGVGYRWEPRLGGRRSSEAGDTDVWWQVAAFRAYAAHARTEEFTAALDELLDKTGTRAQGVDKVFLTGGTSFVPAVRRLFTDRFDASRIETGGELISIAHGLALIGERDDIAQWTVPQ